MQSDLEYLRGKIDKIDDHIDNIDKTLAVNTNLLGEHIKRTNILEDQMSTVKEHVTKVNTVFKIVVWCIGAVVTIIAAICGLR